MQESQENYLETIYRLSLGNEVVRSVDVANTLNYSKASISRAMKLLKEKGYLKFDENNELILTELGLEKAKAIYEKHRIITSFLVKTLNLDPEVAEKDACRIEHVISEEAFNLMKKKVGENNG